MWDHGTSQMHVAKLCLESYDGMCGPQGIDPILVGLVKAHRVVVGQWTAWSSGQLSMHQEQAGDWDWEERPNLDVSSTTAGEGKQSSGQRVQLMTSTDSLT